MRHLLAATAIVIAAAPASASTKAYQELLAADRAWSARATTQNAVDGLAAMFDEKAVMISGGMPDFVRGREAIRARLAARPENATAKAEWAPVSGGISADGTHGYTYGALTLRPADAAPVHQKYLAYWVKRPAGWRVFAYKRAGRRETGPLKIAPALIGVGRHGAGAGPQMAASEKAFSDEAQRIGLRAAFKRWGRAESVNIGAEDAVAVGAEAIGDGVAGPEPTSSVTWAADEHVIAGSGDMGLTYGLLHLNAPQPGQPAFIPFFTVWARPKPGDPWRYVAE
jgi:ketosteroid isomerase-like protein